MKVKRDYLSSLLFSLGFSNSGRHALDVGSGYLCYLSAEVKVNLEDRVKVNS